MSKLDPKPTPTNLFGIDDKLVLTGSERRAYESYMDKVAKGEDVTAGRNFLQNLLGGGALSRMETAIQEGKVSFKNGQYVHSDGTPLMQQGSKGAGLTTEDLLKLRVATELTARKDTQLYEEAIDEGIDVTGALSGTQLTQKLKPIRKEKETQENWADQGVKVDRSQGVAGMNASGRKQKAEQDDEILTNSAEWGYREGRDKVADANSDRNFALNLQTLTSQNEQALATLQASIEQAKMQNEQATLDREYLDRRDLRDYNYQIKKDDQDQMDKIFALLIGGIDKMF